MLNQIATNAINRCAEHYYFGFSVVKQLKGKAFVEVTKPVSFSGAS